MPEPLTGVSPTLLGQTVFGDSTQFAASVFAGSASAADAWLGNPAGTTTYGPCQGAGGALAIEGVMTGTSVSAVQAAQAALAAMAGLEPGPAVLPTGLGTYGWDRWESCYFGATDLAWSSLGIVQVGSGGWSLYQLAYRLILRHAAGPQWAGSATYTAPTTGLWQPVPDGSNWRPINGPGNGAAGPSGQYGQ